jgi:hypothetical protein
MFRPQIFVVAVFALGGTSISAFAKTCTASGHPTCTVSCPAGCAVLYKEPNGPCYKTCSGANGNIVGEVYGASRSQIRKLLGR